MQIGNRLTRRRFLGQTAGAAVAAWGSRAWGGSSLRPNVLVILCDDMRWDAMSCAGHRHLQTPNIDRLAEGGVRFRNAFCTTSLCSPSRASILSGLYAHAHGVMNNFTEYPARLDSFPRRLKEAGWQTAYIGKWHMGEDNDDPRPGFDYWVSHKGQGKYYGTEFNFNGTRRVLEGYYTHVVTDLAVEWLSRPHSSPWMLILGHKAPHSFYVPEPKYQHLFDQVKIEYPSSAFKLEGKPDWVRQRLDTWHGIYGPLFDFRKKYPDRSPEGVRDFAAMTRAYWATIKSVDDSVGRLVEALGRSGQLQNTLILFMGDNGLLNGEHGMVDKRTMHEPSIRIPLLVHCPAILPVPRVVDEQVLTIDVAPSILEWCGVEGMKQAHGRSLAGLARTGSDPSWRKSWFYAYNYEKEFPYTPNVRGVRTERWKYMHYPHGDGSPDRHRPELYNLRDDPEELHNLAEDPSHAGIVEQLRAEMHRLMQAAGALPDRMPIDQGIKGELPEQRIR